MRTIYGICRAKPGARTGRRFAVASRPAHPLRPLSGRTVCVLLWLVFGSVFLASLPNRFAHLDDAWLGEQAYWLAREGVVRSELFRGFLGYEERIFVFHKLFVPQGALAIEGLGWSRSSVKLVSLPWFGATLALLLAAVRSRSRAAVPGEPRTDSSDAATGAGTAAWVGLLFVAHPLVVDYAYTFRPELCLSTFGLVSCLALLRHLSTRGRGSVAAIAVAAVAAGLGFLVHMNGFVFIGAGLAVLLAHRRWREAVLFATVAAALAALYGLDAWRAGSWEVLVRQFGSDPSLDERDFSAAGSLLKLLGEPRRWFRHGEDVALSALVATALAVGGRRLLNEQRTLLLYTISAIVLLGLTAQSKTPKYGVPLYPQLMLLVGAGLGAARSGGVVRRRAFVAVAALFLVVCGSRSWRYFQRNGDEPARHARLLADVDAQAPVVADLTFAFDELERHTLRGLWAYRVRAEARGEELGLEGLLEEARADGVRFVVLDLRRSLPRRIAGQWPDVAPIPGVVERPAGAPDALVLEILEPETQRPETQGRDTPRPETEENR